jgi:DNA-directed RNA polymerase specialized sigma54-like protein
MIKLKEVLKKQINEAPEQHEVYEALQKIVAGLDDAEYGINDLGRINFESRDKSQAKKIVKDFKSLLKLTNKFYSDVDRGKIKTSEF